MQEYRVGEPFPLQNPLGKNDYIVAAIAGQSFDVICWANQPSSKEVQAWKRGMLRYGAFVRDDIPFFLLYSPELKWPLDVSLNILIEKEAGRPCEGYLASAGNAVNLFLVDAATNTLKAMRMIGLDNSVAAEIRLACINQLERYRNAAEAAEQLDAIISTTTTQEMITATRMVELPSR